LGQPLLGKKKPDCLILSGSPADFTIKPRGFAPLSFESFAFNSEGMKFPFERSALVYSTSA